MTTRSLLLAAAVLLTLGSAAPAFAQTEGCTDPTKCTVPPPPEIEDTRNPCEKLGGCQSFGKRSRRKGGLSGFGTRTEKTNVSFSSRRRAHTSVFKAGVKKGKGRKGRHFTGSRRKRH